MCALVGVHFGVSNKNYSPLAKKKKKKELFTMANEVYSRYASQILNCQNIHQGHLRPQNVAEKK